MTTWGTAAIHAIAPIFSLLGFAPPHLGEVLVEEDGVVVRTKRAFALRPTPSLVLAPVRVIRLAWRYDPLQWQADPLLAQARSRCRMLEARDLRELPCDGLLATLHEALTIPAPMGELRRRYFPRAALSAGLLRLTVLLLGQEERFMALAWVAAREELLGHRLLRLRPLRSVFVALLAQARRLLQIREDTHFHATMPLPVVRRTMLELG